MTGPADVAANFDMLAVAYGLSSAILDRNCLTPFEVGPLQPTLPVLRDRAELLTTAAQGKTDQSCFRLTRYRSEIDARSISVLNSLGSDKVQLSELLR